MAQALRFDNLPFQMFTAIYGGDKDDAMPLRHHVLTNAPTGPLRSRICELEGFAHEESRQAYAEDAFHYFLEIERKRSELSNRPFLLMLIDFKRNAEPGRQIDAAIAAKLFTALAECLRETDFTGWYREGRTIGAVLTQHGQPNGNDLSEVVRQRIVTALESRISSDLGCGLQVRVYQLSPNSQCQLSE
jgi:hypothetical protein